MAQIRIGVPVYRTILPETLASLWQLRLVDTILDLQVGADVSIARNQIVSRLKEPHLLLVDTDMKFSAQHVDVLHRALEKDPGMGAIAAHYIRWDGSCQPVCNWRDNGSWINNKERAKRTVRYQKDKSIQEVDMCGGGLWLIDKKVFDSMERPWFRTEIHPDDSGTGNAIWGNDTVFCQRMKRHGWRPSVHFGVSVPHVGPTPWHVEALEALVDSQMTIKDREGTIGDGDGN